MTLTDTTPIPTTVDCSACGTTHDKHLITLRSGEQLAEPAPSGWFLPFKHFGYYDGFDDDIPVLIGGEEYEHWWLCHDCVVKFLTAFPLLGEKVGRGCHPTDHEGDIGTDSKPCCKWSWTMNTNYDADGEVIGHETFLATDDGKWELQKKHQ
jgi:hypothetical protein